MDETTKMIGLGLLVGTPFGYLLHRSGMYKPQLIKEQLRLRDWTMVKTFGSALASSVACVTAMHSLDMIDLCPKPFFPIATLAGGGLVGLGMHMSGACPGTIFAQLGCRTRGALTVFAGCLTGAMAFGYAHPFIVLHTSMFANGVTLTLFEHMDLPMYALSLPLLGAILAGLYVLERYSPVPWKHRNPASVLGKKLSPYTSGALIGLLQVPSLLLAKATIGCSTAFSTIASEARKHVDDSSNYYFSKHLLSPKMWWKLSLDLGIMLGSFASAIARGDIPPNEEKERYEYSVAATKYKSPWGRYSSIMRHVRLFAGGFCLLFGARLADGCTSGHGLSGIAQLSVSSLVATFTMFASGLVAGRLF